jgi:hypothetical protein
MEVSLAEVYAASFPLEISGKRNMRPGLEHMVVSQNPVLLKASKKALSRSSVLTPQ